MHQDVASQYDYATTEDPELLCDRKDSAEIIYKIFVDSSYNDGRFLIDGTQVIKIPKDSISEVFNYVKDELLNIKKLNPIELVISINEFFDFNYDYEFKSELDAYNLFYSLGAKEVHALDISDYEGADIIFDLNSNESKR